MLLVGKRGVNGVQGVHSSLKALVFVACSMYTPE